MDERFELAQRMLDIFPEHQEVFGEIMSEYAQLGLSESASDEFVAKIGRSVVDRYKSDQDLEAIKPYISFLNSEYGKSGRSDVSLEGGFILLFPDPLEDTELASLLSPKVRKSLDADWDWRAEPVGMSFVSRLCESFPQLQPFTEEYMVGRANDVLTHPFSADVGRYLVGCVVSGTSEKLEEVAKILAHLEDEHGVEQDVDDLIVGSILGWFPKASEDGYEIVHMLGPKLKAAYRLQRGIDPSAQLHGSNTPNQESTRSVGSLDAARDEAAELLNVETSVFDESAKEFPEIEAYYLWENIRGGRALVIGYDGSVLFANSSVRPTDHRQAFVDGKRTPLEKFE